MSTDQAEGTTVSPESAQEFKWEIPEASVTLGPTFYVHADSMFVLMQMVYSTMNSWSPSVQITARVYGSNGEKKFSTISESSTGFEVSDDWLSAKCGPMTIDRVAGDELKYRVVFDTPDLKLDIVHWCEVAPFLVGPGLHPFIENEPELGFVRSSFVPRATSVGKVIVEGVETAIQGRGCLTFVKQLNPHHIALWNFCSFQSETHSLMLYQFHMPQGSEKSVVSQGSLVVDGRYEAITVENTVTFHETEYDEFSGYNIPTSLTTEWTGQTADGQPISIVMNLKLNNLLDKIDILSELPYIIRVFVQTFITAPYVYQWLEDSTISIKIGESDLVQVRGSAFHESSFMGDY